MGRPKKVSVPIPTKPIDEIIAPIPIPWNEVVKEMLSRPIKIQESISEGQSVLVNARIHAWKMALHWLIRWEWHPKHKIPGKRSIAEGYIPKGRFLQELFRLCERCHAFQSAAPDIIIPYPHAAYWFGIVFWEHIIYEVQSAIKPSKKREPKGPKKEVVLQERRELSRKYRDFQNPLPDDSVMESTHKLYKLALRLAESSDAFKKNYWDKFIEAWEAETKQLDTPAFGRLFVEDGKAYMQASGPGRGKMYVALPPLLKSELENSNLLSIYSKAFSD
uniref:Uncharacterized protein n=1 Tax=Tolypothrix bouteillei VB521301 TaxID=1479485 RepID=A0A0C1RNF6_9CYAN